MREFFRRLRRRLTRRRAVASVLTHEEALRLLVDYHFNRLPAEASARVEEHIRSCASCQRAGLGHARTERHNALRQLSSVRPSRRRRIPRVSRRAVVGMGALCLCAATVLGVLTHRLPSTAQILGDPGVGLGQTPSAALIAKLPLALSSTGATAVAVDPGGHTIAVAGAYGGTPTITLWRVADGQLTQTLAWPRGGVPTTLAWSPSGTVLAASDGTFVASWDLRASPPQWVRNAPTGASAGIFLADDGTTASTPNLTGSLTTSAFLRWAADGQLAPAPVGAADPLGVALSNGPLVGVWRTHGTHFIFHGTEITAGPGAEPTKSQRPALDWSPDGRYLLYSIASQPVALPDTTTSATTQRGAPPPDAILAQVLQHISTARQGDGLAWFSETGQHLAVCDRSSNGAPLQVYDLKTSRLMAALPGVCDALTSTTVAWIAQSNMLVVALPSQPVRIYAAD